MIIFKLDYESVKSGLIILKPDPKPVRLAWPSINPDLKISRCDKACNLTDKLINGVIS